MVEYECCCRTVKGFTGPDMVLEGFTALVGLRELSLGCGHGFKV